MALNSLKISSRPSLALTDLSIKRRMQFLDMIGSLTRARMQALATFFVPLFGKYDIKFPENTPEKLIDNISKLLCGGTPGTLGETSDAFAYLFGNLDTVEKAYAALPRAYADVLDTILADVYISATKIRLTIETNLEKIPLPAKRGELTENYVSYDAVTGMLQRASGRGSSEVFTLETQMLDYLGAVLQKGLYEQSACRICAELPDGGEGFKVWSCADQLISLLPRINDSIQAGEIEATSSTGVVKATSIKMFSLTYPLEEFFPASPVRSLRDVRMRASLSMVYAQRYLLKRSKKSDSEKLREIFNTYIPDPYQISALALPFVSGQRKAYFSVSSLYGIKRWLCEALVKFPEGEWIDVADITTEIFRSAPGGARVGLATSVLDDYVFRPMQNNATGSYITRTNIIKDYTLPLYRGLLVDYCAFGFLEMAVSQRGVSPDCPLDAVRYVRLSPFGRWCLGLSKKYEPATEEVAAVRQAELDPDRLVITALTESSASIIKAQFGTPLGANRFEVTEASIYRKAQNKTALDQLKTRLATFAEISQFPPLWNEFFARMEKHYSAISRVKNNKYILYEIDPTCPGLAEVIVGDPEVRRLVRLVEGNMFMVSNNDIDDLTHALARHGYPLPKPAYSYYYY